MPQLFAAECEAAKFQHLKSTVDSGLIHRKMVVQRITELQGKAFNLPVGLRSSCHLWPRALSIERTRGQNEFLPPGWHSEKLRHLERGPIRAAAAKRRAEVVGELIRIPPGHLSHIHLGGDPWVDQEPTGEMLYLYPAWGRPRSSQEELKSVGRQRDVWNTLLTLLPSQPTPISGREWMDRRKDEYPLKKIFRCQSVPGT